MKPTVLTFDIGTSSCKCALFDGQGEVLCLGRGSYSVHKFQDGRIEQDPAEIRAGVCASLRDVIRAGWSLEGVRAIGISAQMAAHCLVDERGMELTPIMSWMDQRAKPQMDAYNRCFSQEDTARMTGMDMLITPAHTLTKMRWMHENIPQTLKKARYIVQVKDMLIHALTGRWVCDATTLKGIVDQQSKQPISEILDFTGCLSSLIVPVGMPYETAGLLLANVPGFEGLPAGIPVVVGWNDMNAAYLGMVGLAKACTGLDLTGTSEHIGIMTQEIPKNFVCNGVNRVPFLQGRQVCYGVTSSGGQAFDWYVKKVYAQGSSTVAYRELLEDIQMVTQDKIEDLIFLPYLEGERNPWNAPGGRGVFFGLNGNHTRLDMAYAVMEGVCFALQTILERMPMKPQSMIVAGGAARNDFWNQMKADAMQVPYRLLHTTEAGCNGAAILAMANLQPDMTLEEIAARMTGTVKTYEPNSNKAGYYAHKYKRYVNLYRHLQADFERE
ncbi:MAG: FGGY family carbohydrate kinase [Clostridia bacterium]